jgi:6,7-dimethyl-8-ribityllumazine synthase
VSGDGAPATTRLDGRGLRIAIVVSRWHDPITSALLAGAERALAAARVEDPGVVRVPGAFELPVVAKALAAQRYDGVVALGVVIRGGTPHFDYVLPDSSEDKGREAAMAAVETALVLRRVRRGDCHEEADQR